MCLVGFYFLRKTKMARRKTRGLGHAFVWVFRDEDQDGEPDWEDSSDLIEEFGKLMKTDTFLSIWRRQANIPLSSTSLANCLLCLQSPLDLPSKTQAKQRSWVMLSALIGNRMFVQILLISKKAFIRVFLCKPFYW